MTQMLKVWNYGGVWRFQFHCGARSSAVAEWTQQEATEDPPDHQDVERRLRNLAWTITGD